MVKITNEELMDVTLVGLASALMMISPAPLDASQLSHNPTSAAPFLFLSWSTRALSPSTTPSPSSSSPSSSYKRPQSSPLYLDPFHVQHPLVRSPTPLIFFQNISVLDCLHHRRNGSNPDHRQWQFFFCDHDVLSLNEATLLLVCEGFPKSALICVNLPTFATW